MTYQERSEKLGSFAGLERSPEPQKRVTPTSRDPNMVLIDIEDDRYKEFYDKCAKYEHSTEQELLKCLVAAFNNGAVVPRMRREEIDTLNCSKIPLFLPSFSRSLLIDKCEKSRLNMYLVLSSLIENFIDERIIIEERFPRESHFAVNPNSPVRVHSKPFLVAQNSTNE
jgi:hypothetical protein